MNELDKIVYKSLMDELERKNRDVMNMYKALQIILNKLLASTEEIESLIKYFESIEEYEICNKLKSKLI